MRMIQLGRQRSWPYVGTGWGARWWSELPRRHLDRQASQLRASRCLGRRQVGDAAVVLGGPSRCLDDSRAGRKLRRRASAVGQRAGPRCHWRSELGSSGRGFGVLLPPIAVFAVHNHGFAEGHATQAPRSLHDARLEADAMGGALVVILMRLDASLWPGTNDVFVAGPAR